MLVDHPGRPEWGPGKVVHVKGQKVHIVFRDVPDRKAKVMDTSIAPVRRRECQHDDVLDNLPPVAEEDGSFCLPVERLTVKQALGRFRDRYPQGFSDPGYLGTAKTGERCYKWAAHRSFVELLGHGELRRLLGEDIPELAERAFKCVGKVNLVSPFEQAAFRDALKDTKAAGRFFSTLAQLLDATEISQGDFEPYAEAVLDLPAERGRAATWPVATILPFLAQPERHLFLKPGITKAAAERLGFELNYRPEPNWLTYECLLRMAGIYREKIAELGPRDMIDVQSFFWVVHQASDG
jgi:hypothetical protein